MTERPRPPTEDARTQVQDAGRLRAPAGPDNAPRVSVLGQTLAHKVRVDDHTLAAPLGRYSHIVETPPGARLLYLSGQVPVAKDGTTPTTLATPPKEMARRTPHVSAV